MSDHRRRPVSGRGWLTTWSSLPSEAIVQRSVGGMSEVRPSLLFCFLAARFSLRVRVGFFFELVFGVDLSAMATIPHRHARKRAQRMANNRCGHRRQGPKQAVINKITTSV